jgi:hypothetical protein
MITQINSLPKQHSNSVGAANALSDKPSDQHSNSVNPANALPGVADKPSDQHSNSVDPAHPLPGAVDNLSDPRFHCQLAFPSVTATLPERFKVTAGIWQYDGRTKFKELLQELKNVRNSEVYTKVFSPSANNMDFFKQINRRGSYKTLHVYGGLTKVSHLKISVTMRLLTRLGGNGAVVETT